MKKMTSKVLVVGALWLLLLPVVSPVYAGNCSTELNNNALCPPPTPAPTLPAAGGTFTDPTFGTTIIRVTDENDGNGNMHYYSYISPFNANSTRFFLKTGSRSNGSNTLYTINNTSNKISKVGSLPGYNESSMVWHPTNPDIYYAADGGLKIVSYNVVTKAKGTVKDFSGTWSGVYLWQMSMSDDGDVFAFTLKNSNNYSEVGIGAYRVSTGKVYRWDTSPIDECQIDKSGNFVFLHKGSNASKTVWNLNTGEKTTITPGTQYHDISHYDQGSGFIVGSDGWASEGLTLSKRELSNPLGWVDVFVGQSWNCDAHISLRNNDNQYGYVSTVTPDGSVTKPMENEIIQFTLDGSKNYRRLAHTRSSYRTYEATPRVAVDRNGKYLMFGSDWDNSGRLDVFILVIPDSVRLSGDAVAPGAPNPLTVKQPAG
ncbi:MAG: hypothetical protein OES12_12695 [Anaerolineae bacterium]|nr:hypothetical protein [Anaerolineae bacterium]